MALKLGDLVRNESGYFIVGDMWRREGRTGLRYYAARKDGSFSPPLKRDGKIRTVSGSESSFEFIRHLDNITENDFATRKHGI